MPRWRNSLPPVIWVVMCSIAAGQQQPAGEQAAGVESAERPGRPESFEADIAPLFEAHCVECHGGERREAGLDLRRRWTLLEGGDSGPALVPRGPDQSLVLSRVESGEMPPEDRAPLDEKQKRLLRRWIEQGAPLAGDSEEPLGDADPPSRLSEEDRAFWAFQAPRRPLIPPVRAADRVRTPIDALLLAKLESHGLSFNPDASKLTLLRRLCFDLHGLPPTPAQIAEFMNDDRPDAYERLVDRLLASPRYGERWARHWLDVAGYADSDGYLAADRYRPQAWRYRDYVIRSLNEDLPYDQFVREQLAGDELVDWRRAEELTSEMIDSLVATGFLRTASDPTYPGYIEPNECHQVMSDTIQIISSALMGLTIQCARCHAHKFDPISQRDYYALNSILLASYDPQEWLPSETRGIPMASEAEQARINEQNRKVDERLAELTASLADLNTRYRKKLIRETLQIDPAVVDPLAEALGAAAESRTLQQAELVARQAPDISASEEDLSARYAAHRREAARFKAAIEAERSLREPIELIRGLIDLDDEPREGHVLRRGEHDKPGAAVAAGVPEVLAPAGFQFEAEDGYKTSGLRTQLARWLTDPEHPLTARTQVNRMWAHHFGVGLVPTLANLGRSGSRPTNQELLDWLATELVRQGWSLKAMHRVMLNSTAYRQSSAPDEAALAADPENVLLWSWRPRRHEGEVLRDSMLAVSGKLDLQMYGPAVNVHSQGDGSVTTGDEPGGNRRSVYMAVRRSQHLTMLELFDTPIMEVNCPQRVESIVPMQALAMQHGPFAERSALALAARLAAETPSDEQARIDLAYRLLFARPPSAMERSAVAAFIEAAARETLGAGHANAEGESGDTARRAAWIQASLVWLNCDEFIYVH